MVPPKRPLTIRDVFRHTTGYGFGISQIGEAYDRIK